jgi:hypothetical protein
VHFHCSSRGISDRFSIACRCGTVHHIFERDSGGAAALDAIRLLSAH